MNDNDTIMNDTISGLPRLSREYNDGYRTAILDIIEVFNYMDNDFKGHSIRMNNIWAKKILQCCLENREKLRDDWDGFIRITKSDSGKFDAVEWAKNKERKRT